MDEQNSGPESSGPNAVGRASDLYNTAVSQAGPGWVANGCVLMVLTIVATQVIQFIDNPLDTGTFSQSLSFKERWYTAFEPRSLGFTALFAIAAILICRVTQGELRPLGKRTMLFALGILEALAGVVMVISTILIFTISDNNTGTLKFTSIATALVYTILVLTVSLWATAESRKS